MCKSKVSVRQIAKICGVSPSTVSRVLNHSGSISVETQEKIYAAAKELNYFPAQPNQRNMIAVIQPRIGIPFLSDICHHIETYFFKKGYTVIFTSSNLSSDDMQKNANAEHKTIEALCQLGIRGAIVLSMTPDNPELPFTPVPVVYGYMEDNGSTPNATYSVSSDQIIGGQLAAQELIRKGCIRPIVLLNSHYSPKNSGRYDGFFRTFEEYGHPIPERNIIHADGTRGNVTESHDIVQYLIAKKMKFDSIYAGSDWRAYGALTALLEAGIKVPEDMKVIGFDGSAIATLSPVPITSIMLNPHAIAQQLCRMLDSLIDGREILEKHITTPVQLFTGKTT